MKYSSFSLDSIIDKKNREAESKRKSILKGIEVMSQWNLNTQEKKKNIRHTRFLSENNNLYH